MAITLHPKRNTTVIRDAEADSFISGAGKSIAAVADQDSGRKPIVIRIPADLLKRIDQAAKKKSISRSSFIVSSMADLVNGDR